MHTKYDVEIEKLMITLYESLSEKNRRRYAAVEAKKIGYGGANYMSILFSCDPKTIQRGIEDLDSREEMKKKDTRSFGGGPM